MPGAYCSAVFATAGTEGLLPTRFPVSAPTDHSQLVSDSRWDEWARPRITAISADHLRLASQATGNAAAPLESRYAAQTARLASLLVVIDRRLHGVFAHANPARRRALDATLRAFDVTGASAWSTYEAVLNAYNTLCFAPQHVVAALERVASLPNAITAATLSAAAQVESASMPGLVVTVLSVSPVDGPLSSARFSVELITGGVTAVAPITVCVAFPIPGTAPANVVTC